MVSQKIISNFIGFDLFDFKDYQVIDEKLKLNFFKNKLLILIFIIAMKKVKIFKILVIVLAILFGGVFAFIKVRKLINKLKGKTPENSENENEIDEPKEYSILDKIQKFVEFIKTL